MLGGFYLHLVPFLQFLKMSRWKPLVQHEIDAGLRNIKPDRESEFAHFSMAIKSGTQGRYTVRKTKGNGLRSRRIEIQPPQIGRVLGPFKVALIGGRSKMVIVKADGDKYPLVQRDIRTANSAAAFCNQRVNPVGTRSGASAS